MKKIYFVLCLFCVVFSTYADNIFSGSFSLNWEVQSWKTTQYEAEVLFFDDAVFLHNSLPYFQKSILLPANTVPEIHIENAVYEPLTEREKMFLTNTGIPITNTELELETGEQREFNKKYAVISFLPIINIDGELKKLVTFDLIVSGINTPALRSPQINATLHTYAESSVLKSGKWVKMRVGSSGIYQVTYDQIVSAGLDPNDIHIFGYGGGMLEESFLKAKTDDLPQVAVHVEKGDDGVFNSGDYILFYAQGPTRWSYNAAKKEFQHVINPYSLYGYYFLASGLNLSQNNMTTLPDVDLQGRTPQEITTYYDYYLHENEWINLLNSGRVFYGEEYSPQRKSIGYSFSMPNVDESSQAVMTVDAAIGLNSTSPYIRVASNGTSANLRASNAVSNADPFHFKGLVANNTFSFTPQSQLSVETTLYENGASSLRAWLNYIRITAKHHLVMKGDVMFFRNVDFTQSDVATFRLSTEKDLMIWDITTPHAIKKVNATFNQSQKLLTFTVENPEDVVREYVAVTKGKLSGFAKPEIVGAIENQDLHGLDNYEYIIIAHPDYLTQAQKLAQAHWEKDNLSVVIVTPEQIYNEFSSGTPDATAYRWFAKMFYDRKNNGLRETELKYMLLFGDGSFDNRQITTSPDGNDRLLTFQSYNSLIEAESSGPHISYVTDDYFGFLDDSEGTSLQSDKLDIGIGRFPVNTPAHADAMVNKTIKYMQNKSVGSWKNLLCFLGDDGDSDSHMEHADAVAKSIAQANPEFQIMKLYMDAFKQEITSTGEAYPEVRKKLLDQIKKGALLLNYSGHGGAGGWTNEKVLTNNDIISMYNDNMALWVTATCDFSRFDSKILTAGENVVLNPNGGSVASFTTTRVVYTGPNRTLNLKFADHVFKSNADGSRYRLGDIIKFTKHDTGSNHNKLNFTLLGDPALLLSYPTHNVVTDSINGFDASANQVTIGALSRVTLKGHVTDENNEFMSNFNGYVNVSVFDKEQTMSLLNNDGCTGCGRATYKDRSIISLGKTEVTNGEFEITFMMPKDINYSTGSGKMIYYAYDEETEIEANGYFSDFNIGGASDEIFTDNEGPEIQMYLNTPLFNNGDIVNESPLFVAHLADENGINVIGNGVGHDIVLMWNDKDWIVLNDYYEPDMSTYKSGRVTYKMSDLPDGKYTLNFRAWDLLNNSSSASFDFEVRNGYSMGILDSYCYPNPASNFTTFVLKHNRPDEVLDVTLRIYDLAGRQLWYHNANVYATDDVITITDWDLSTGSGQRLKRGVYLYKVEVSSGTTDKISTKTKKIIVN